VRSDGVNSFTCVCPDRRRCCTPTATSPTRATPTASNVTSGAGPFGEAAVFAPGTNARLTPGGGAPCAVEATGQRQRHGLQQRIARRESPPPDIGVPPTSELSATT
jgi:hypothetical protein